MILELDAGNSRVKWRIIDAAGSSVQSGAVSSIGELQTLAISGSTVARARMACVAASVDEQAIADWVRRRFGVEPEVARTRLEYNGLRIAYEDPQRLGVDRWLVMLAARSATVVPVCVIDCGSAVTIDLVDAGGRHLGGYIVPGPRLQREALLRDTGQIQMTQAAARQANEWGRSTEEAVHYGINRMLLSLVNSVLAELVAAMPEVQIFFTGGDADIIMQQIETELPCVQCPELVLDGLALALP